MIDLDPSAAWPAGPERSGPLAGVRVLDFSRILAGPYATMHLADLGADVIKVELPGHGDETRHWGPPFTDDGISSYFLAINHNKRSITLDLSDEDGAAIARHLARHADVVVDNFLPGKMSKFGLDREAVALQNPGVITATVSGFGMDNPYAGRPGFDFLAQAMGGLMAVTGQPGEEPTRVGVAITDLVAGLFAVIGITSVLDERRQTGTGRHIDISLLDSQISMLVNLASGWLTAGVEPARFGNRHPSIAPYETLRTADSPLAVACGTDRQFASLVTVLGLEKLAWDERFVTNRGRVTNREALVDLLEAALTQRPRDHWMTVLLAAGVPVAPVNTLPEVFADPVIRSRMITTVDGVPQVRSPLRLDGEALDVFSRPPHLGEHTEVVLRSLGIPAGLIDDLRSRGVV